MTNCDLCSWGQRVLETALAYANHQWIAHDCNVMHGIDQEGRFVDTPDVTWKGEILDCGWWKPSEINVGIPYGWGNASTIDEFDAGIREGKFAGNVPEDKKRYGSHHTVGVDCSGLLTVCWELPQKIATRDIPEYASVIEHIEDMRPGDIFAKVGSHLMLFKEFTDAERASAVIIDSTRSTGKVSQRTVNVAELFSNGYQAYRKK